MSRDKTDGASMGFSSSDEFNRWLKDAPKVDERKMFAKLASDYDQLKAECERLQMQLVACGVIALANTPESACEARKMHPDYMSASCSDVANAVDREMKLRKQLDEARKLLEHVQRNARHWWQGAVDAWLEANKP